MLVVRDSIKLKRKEIRSKESVVFKANGKIMFT